MHPKRNAEYLHLVPNVENPRICKMCVIESKIPRENYQEIKEILEESSENDMLTYPVLTDSEPREILQNIGGKMEFEINLMEKYFSELTNSIEVIIGRIK